jgi:hypothetical protein
LEASRVIQITPQMRLLLAVEPVDFRKGIDGLVQVCRQRLDADPMTGALFVFSNRRRRALKILCYDGQGYWLCQKRLSQGRFGWCCCGTVIPTTPKRLRCGVRLDRRLKPPRSKKIAQTPCVPGFERLF